MSHSPCAEIPLCAVTLCADVSFLCCCCCSLSAPWGLDRSVCGPAKTILLVFFINSVFKGIATGPGKECKCLRFPGQSSVNLSTLAQEATVLTLARGFLFLKRNFYCYTVQEVII